MTILVSLNSINDNMISGLFQTCKKHKGLLPVKVEIIDPSREIKLDFMSTKNKVEVSGDLLAELEDLGIAYKLN